MIEENEKRKCQACESENIVLVQYMMTSQDYDGISEIKCLDCGARYGRWSLKRLGDDEIERRYGG